MSDMVKDLLWGETKELLLPSGRMVTIREQNGNDDDVLSNSVASKDLSNISQFIAGIVVETNFTASKKLSIQDVKDLLLRDKYYILFSSRIHSIGDKLKFKYSWGENNGGDVIYEEDLSKYIWDYTEEFPDKPNDPNYFKYRMQPYHQDAYGDQFLTLPSGKELRFKCLDGNAEAFLLKMNAADITKNTELKARGLSLKNKEGGWDLVQNFKFFTKKDMMVIHKEMDVLDSAFTGLTELENPLTGELIGYPLMQSMDFFYPQEI